MQIGPLTVHALGIIMRDVVLRAMHVIRDKRFTHRAEAKVTAYKSGADLVTDADREAQAVYVKILRECFPDCGIVAEEGELSVPSKNGLFFTVDPLDGTKAYGRLENTGVATMLSLVRGEEVVAACIGDVMTGDLYYYRPGSPKVHHIDPRSTLHDLCSRSPQPLAGQYLLLRDEVIKYPPAVGKIMGPAYRDRLFRSCDVMGGSIGIGFARLWNGSVGSMVLKPGAQTPWDLCPVLGISRKLGYRFLSLEELVERGRVRDVPLVPMEVIQETVDTLLVVHGDNVPELAAVFVR